MIQIVAGRPFGLGLRVYLGLNMLAQTKFQSASKTTVMNQLP